MGAPGTTPGPWAVHPIKAQVDCATFSTKGGLLPVCQLLWPTDERIEAETEANAHQIAASGALYDAAVEGLISVEADIEAREQELRDRGDDLETDDWLATSRARAKSIRAALALARGESPHV